MDFYQIILLLLIIILSCLIIFQFYQNKFQLSNKFREPFGFNTAENEFENVSTSELYTTVQSVPSKHDEINISQFVVKGSYNTAFTGKHMNLDMIQYVLSRGCRYLDFEVFYIQENDTFKAVVACSDDPTFSTLKSDNHLLLDDIFTTVNSYAHSFTTPNRKDPLFINLRIKSNDTNVYPAVAKSVNEHLKSTLFEGKITKDTLMKDIKDKTVLVVDKTIHRNYKDYHDCNDPQQKCIKLSHSVNLESGSDKLNMIRYNEIFEQKHIPIMIHDDNITTNLEYMKLVVPDLLNDNLHNPDINDLVIHYGAQMVPFCFYKKDIQLEKYEEFFNENRSAFVPLGVAIAYFKKLNDLENE